MRVNKDLMAMIVVVLSIIALVEGVCPNNCSGHGTCVNSVCKCFSDLSESYGGNDCSEHICFKGNPFGAVHSVSPSENGVSYSSNNVRELYEYYSNERQAEEEVCKPATITLDTQLDTAGKLWKVTGLEVLVDGLYLSGGILSCKYYDKSNLNVVLGIVDVQSYGVGYQYVLFDGKVTKGDSSISITIGGNEYSKIECDDILSVRDDLSQVNPPEITVSSGDRRSLSSDNSTRKLEEKLYSFTWNGYGPILKDMGLLTLDKTENKYTNDKFSFACYPVDASKDPSAAVTTNTPVTVYNDVKAEYEEAESNYNVKFTFKSDDSKLSVGSICLCLMDSVESIALEDSEAFNNMRDDNNKDDNKYLIGKYPPATSGSTIIDDSKYPIAVTSNSITSSSKFTITFTSENEKYKLYFIEKRVLYATVLTAGIFKEIPVKIQSVTDSSPSYEVTIEAITDSGVIMPYLRISPISELTSSPTPVIEEG